MYIRKKTSIKIVVSILLLFFFGITIYHYLNKNFSNVSVDLTTGSIEMHDFHRVSNKNGKKVWEIFGKQVKYSPAKDLASVENAELTFYSEKRGKIRLSSKSADIYLKDSDLNKIDLSNNVLLEVGDEFKAVAEKAYFFHDENKITVPGEIKIFSQMGEITGIGLDADITNQIINIKSDVHSVLNQEKGKL